MDDRLAFIAEKYGLDLGKGPRVDIPNLDRAGLAKLFAELGFIYGAEIGVEKGANATLLCQNIPNLKLLCVDLWKLYRGGGRQQVSRIQQRNLANLSQALSPYDVTIIEKLSMDAVHDVPLGSLDFVYIDANHRFDFVMQDIIEWSKRVKPGGIVSGHDYCQATPGVMIAVDAYIKAHNIANYFVTSSEAWPSYFWVK